MSGDIAFLIACVFAAAFFAVEFEAECERTGASVLSHLRWLCWAVSVWTLGLVLRLIWMLITGEEPSA